jgi:hypothetical protein
MLTAVLTSGDPSCNWLGWADADTWPLLDAPSPCFASKQPPYPASCTAAFHAAQVKHDAVIANDYPAE